MANATKLTRAAHRDLEEFLGEVVAADAGFVRKIFRHRLITRNRLFFRAEMTGDAFDLAMFFLLMREAVMHRLFRRAFLFNQTGLISMRGP